MLRVGLTGGIATGKSTVARMLADLGARVIDADAIARELQRPGGAICKQIVEAFGPCILKADGSIDRARLGELVFSHPEKREILERIMHPPIIAREEEILQEWERSRQVEVAVVEEALLLEVGSRARFHRLLVVTATEEQQVKRLEDKGLSRRQALQRIRAQMPLSRKVEEADYVIDNSGPLEQTRRRVEELYPLLQAEARRVKEASGPAPRTGGNFPISP